MFDVQQIAERDTLFSHPYSVCGSLEFSAELYYFTDPADGRDTQGPIELELSIMDFNANGTFFITTNDAKFLGSHELHIKAKLEDHPDTSTALVILPLEFRRCEIELNEWFTSNVIVPPGTDVLHTFDDPTFTYTDTDICGYFWTDYTVFSIEAVADSSSAI